MQGRNVVADDIDTRHLMKIASSLKFYDYSIFWGALLPKMPVTAMWTMEMLSTSNADTPSGGTVQASKSFTPKTLAGQLVGKYKPTISVLIDFSMSDLAISRQLTLGRQHLTPSSLSLLPRHGDTNCILR